MPSMALYPKGYALWQRMVGGMVPSSLKALPGTAPFLQILPSLEMLVLEPESFEYAESHWNEDVGVRGYWVPGDLCSSIFLPSRQL